MKEDEIGGACSKYMWEEMRVQGLVGKPEEKRPLRKYRRGSDVWLTVHRNSVWKRKTT